jgi:hypothetical protein
VKHDHAVKRVVINNSWAQPLKAVCFAQFCSGTVPGPTPITPLITAQVACLFATRSVWLRVDFRESHRHLPDSLVNQEMVVRPH